MAWKGIPRSYHLAGIEMNMQRKKNLRSQFVEQAEEFCARPAGLSLTQQKKVACTHCARPRRLACHVSGNNSGTIYLSVVLVRNLFDAKMAYFDAVTMSREPDAATASQ